MQIDQTLLVIVPCFNEAEALPALLQKLREVSIPGYALSIAVVNDASLDNTAAIAKKEGVVVLDLPVNLGIGGAVQTGLQYAHRYGFDFALQVDGDGQHPPEEIFRLLQCQAATEANVVIGSRFLEKEGFQSSTLRRTGIRYFYWLNKVFTGNAIFDSTSGFRLLDKNAIAMAAAYYPDEYPEPESLVFFARQGLKIAETPVVMRERAGGQSSIRNFATFYYCTKVTIAMFFSYIRHF